MRKLLAAIILLCGLAGAASADTYTPNYNLVVPSTGSTGWGLKLNANFVNIDTAVAAGLAAVGSSSSSLQVQINTLGVSTGSLRADLTTVDNDLSNEVSARIGGDAALAVSTSALRSDLAAEALARSAADSALGVATGTLRGDLTNETNARIAADASIGVATASLRSDLSSEALARALADGLLGDATGTLRLDLNQEATWRSAADNLLGDATGTLRVDLGNETQGRIDGDAALGVSTAALAASVATRVSKAGDTMTGELVINDDVRPQNVQMQYGGLHIFNGPVSISTSASQANIYIMEDTPPTSTWEDRGLIPNGAWMAPSAYGGGKVYVVGSFEGNVYNRIYDIVSDSWSSGADYPLPLQNASAVFYDGKLYVFGGDGLANVYAYDPLLNTWSAKASMSYARTQTAACAYGSKIYVIGGTPGEGFSDSLVEEFDPALNSWATKTVMPTPRFTLQCGTIGSKIYVVGGTEGATQYNINEEYDPVLDSWATKAAMPIGAQDVAAGVVGGKLYVLDGSTHATQVYDPGLDSWSLDTQSPVQMQQLRGAATNGAAIYIPSGYTDGRLYKLSPGDSGLGPNGSVGIGTTAPGEKLEVVGDVKAVQYHGDGSPLTGVIHQAELDALAVAVAADTSTLRVDLGNETLDRLAGDALLGDATGLLRVDLGAEASDRLAGDSLLGDATGQLRADLGQETLDRISGDSLLGDATGLLRADLGSEISDRLSGDSLLGDATGLLRTDLGSEISDRAAGDSLLGDATGQLRVDLGAEAQARADADGLLGDATGQLRVDLGTESGDRLAGDQLLGDATGLLRTDLSAESLARVNQDLAIAISTSSLRSDLTNETNSRVAGDDALAVSTTAISADAQTRVSKAGDTMTGALVLTSLYSSGNVGISTTIPGALLHVYKGASGAPVYGFANLALESDSHGYLEFLGPASANQGFGFSRPGQQLKGYFQYEHGDDSMDFGVNGGIKLKIKSDGNVGIGTTAPAYKLDVSSDIHTSGDLIAAKRVCDATKCLDQTGTGSGDVVAAGNNAFTGVNTFTGTNTVTGISTIGPSIPGLTVSDSNGVSQNGWMVVASSQSTGGTSITFAGLTPNRWWRLRWFRHQFTALGQTFFRFNGDSNSRYAWRLTENSAAAGSTSDTECQGASGYGTGIGATEGGEFTFVTATTDTYRIAGHGNSGVSASDGEANAASNNFFSCKYLGIAAVSSVTIYTSAGSFYGWTFLEQLITPYFK